MAERPYREYKVHDYDIAFWKKKDKKYKEKPDIEFVTDNGNAVKLVWEKPDYRAYINGVRSKYGATIPQGLIEYMKKNC